MSMFKRLFALVAPLAFLTLSACATGFPAQVQRFQAMPPPPGQSFVIQPRQREDAGSLEFAQYAGLVRQHLVALGYAEAPSADQATLVVEFDFGVDGGRERIVARPDPFGPSWGFPYYSRFGYGFGRGFGRYRSPFFWGWHDPFWGGGGVDIDSYTVYTSFLDLDIRRTADGQSLFEGLAQARSRSNELPILVPNLIEAMFTGFPGNSGETQRITVMPEREQSSR